MMALLVILALILVAVVGYKMPDSSDWTEDCDWWWDHGDARCYLMLFQPEWAKLAHRPHGSHYGLPESWYCGYVRFEHEQSPPTVHAACMIGEGANRIQLSERVCRYDGILTHVPAHGGLTYGEINPKWGVVYGYDCNHGGDDDIDHLKDKNWHVNHLNMVADCIQDVSGYAKEWQDASQERRLEIVSTLHDKWERELEAHFNLSSNFGALLNCLAGDL